MLRREHEATGAVHDAVCAAFPHLVPGLEGAPDSVLGIDPDALTREDLVDAYGSERFHGFAVGLQQTGNCAHPVRLRGSTMRVDARTGELVSQYTSCVEPLGVTHIRCGNRRASECPSCSRLFAGDTFQLIRAGMVGGKTVPDHVADNPLVFATLTAPSFGKVHGHNDRSGVCQSVRRRSPTDGPGTRCAHGRPRTCTRLHSPDDPRLGRPLCPDCYDYDSHVVWQWWAPALWGRFTTALRRAIARRLGVAATRLGAVATLQFAKVAEFQARGAIHFHALIRVDGPKTQGGFASASDLLPAEALASLVREAATTVRLTVPGVDDADPNRLLAFGRQLDVRPISTRKRPDDPTRGLAPEQVAGYLAKYATKSAGSDAQADDAHHRRLRATCRALAVRAGGEPYELLGKWISMLGFRGHYGTKSRRFSVTLGALRRARRRAQALLAEQHRTGVPVDLSAREAELLADDEDEATLVIGSWTFVGTGWANETERVLALAAAARARQYDRQRAQARKTPNKRLGSDGDG